MSPLVIIKNIFTHYVDILVIECNYLRVIKYLI